MRRHLEQQCGKESGHGQRAEQAHGDSQSAEHHRFPHDQPEDIRRLRAQRQMDSDLMDALRDAVDTTP